MGEHEEHVHVDMTGSPDYGGEWLEIAAAAVHQAYLDTCDRLGWPVKSENRVDYADLSDDAKELDRHTARQAIEAAVVNAVVVGVDMYDDVRSRRDQAHDENSRLREIIEILCVDKAQEIVDGPQQAHMWMHTPNEQLEGWTPAQCCRDGDPSAPLNLIGAIADGVVL